LLEVVERATYYVVAEAFTTLFYTHAFQLAAVANANNDNVLSCFATTVSEKPTWSTGPVASAQDRVALSGHLTL
jgi:hypothetical protein